MGKIVVLDEKTASQIAAGEVVERPASVVKELVENSLDAGARRVEVRIAEGGLGEITVADDGAGMAADDAVLAFSRHATSKLTTIQDLDEIGTFGFRGEALASIGSVARVTLTTRPRGEDASEVVVEGGRIAGVGEAGAPEGTRIEVKDLFFNVPARRKFLKTERTEAGHVDQVVRTAALANPEVAFRYVNDGRTLLDIHAAPEGAPLDASARRERAVRCLGKQVRDHLFAFEAETELLKASGYVVSPLETRRDLAGINLSINGRPVRDKTLVQAIRAAYRTLLEVGRNPICALDLQMDPRFVDVNVHPQKAEVRFEDPRRVQSHLIRTLSDFLATTPWLSRQPARSYVLHTGPARSAAEDPAQAHRDRVKAALNRLADTRTSTKPAPRPGRRWRAPAPAAPAPFAPRTLPTLGGAGKFSGLRVVGQVARTYLVLEGPEGMTVIDQHAAHERVTFERLRAGFASGEAPAQKLLFPLQVALSALELSALEANAETLAKIGLEVEPFGESAAVIRSVPRGLDGGKAERAVRDALAELAEHGRSDAINDHVDALCARLACHGSVRAGQVLEEREVRALLRSLDEIDLGAHCPHGRPVVRTMSFDEMAKWFDRR